MFTKISTSLKNGVEGHGMTLWGALNGLGDYFTHHKYASIGNSKSHNLLGFGALKMKKFLDILKSNITKGK